LFKGDDDVNPGALLNTSYGTVSEPPAADSPPPATGSGSDAPPPAPEQTDEGIDKRWLAAGALLIAAGAYMLMKKKKPAAAVSGRRRKPRHRIIYGGPEWFRLAAARRGRASRGTWQLRGLRQYKVSRKPLYIRHKNKNSPKRWKMIASDRNLPPWRREHDRATRSNLYSAFRRSQSKHYAKGRPAQSKIAAEWG